MSMPPFRADHVGSLLRPEALLKARAAKVDGELTADRLREIEDEAIRDVVAMQHDVGLSSATDGEFRRTTWHMDFIYQLGGIAPTDDKIQVHFHNQQGETNITGAEAARIVASDTDYYLRDLYEAIERGDCPKWTVLVQIMPYEEAKTYRFNPFDLTKIWPHADYPLIPIGEFVLDRNPTNYFAEIEQAAFAPSNLVPGIGLSPDKMLLARIFSYADAHRYRIGTNYNELPVNRPRTQVNSYSKDGSVRHFFNDPMMPVYAPNSLGSPAADPTRTEEGGWHADGDFVYSAHASTHPAASPTSIVGPLSKRSLYGAVS